MSADGFESRIDLIVGKLQPEKEKIKVVVNTIKIKFFIRSISSAEEQRRSREIPRTLLYHFLFCRF